MHLYIHIPFCRQACHYCDFHFSTNTKQKREITEAIAREIVLRKEYLPTPELQTIYFGGGTPSLLDEEELSLLLNTIHTHFSVRSTAEITLEANPDDLTAPKLEQLQKAGINRLSIGIQSFDEAHLKHLHRIHTAVEAGDSVKRAQDLGITNISVDLIYAIPAPDHAILKTDVEKVLALDVPHISAYCLTVEPQTVFGNWLKKGKIKPIDEEYAARQFEYVVESLAEGGYEQYEISNFARNSHYSRHNSAYWQRRPYLGVGPSAHSYDGASRQYNINNNAQYLTALQKDQIPATYEQLSPADQVNEYLLTGLRTKWGCRLDMLSELSEGSFLSRQGKEIFRLIESGWLYLHDETLLLTESGKLFADRVTSELFVE
ncbi:radical SAM family heme chaperone HemW [Telluribacter sp. SYSU D00476]|uniref:radical SAM family heme chaperone HemW n=1 Tax=Telluribacter sp. SYSU D00476 TaxID=2811430 RepID=UPI001FF26E0E|nr:radical SAM family heme chaperone HemW [Telluribacter sp. SYSU D00476]